LMWIVVPSGNQALFSFLRRPDTFISVLSPGDIFFTLL